MNSDAPEGKASHALLVELINDIDIMCLTPLYVDIYK